MKNSISIIASIVIFLGFSNIASAQRKTNIGFSLPHFIDNQIELSVQQKLKQRVVIVGVLGGSAKTRGFFMNDGINRQISTYDYQTVSNAFSDRSAGFYGKIGANFTFGLPDFFDETPVENSNFKCFIGPVIGGSYFSQSGRVEDTKYATNGTSVLVSKEVKEKGTLMGTGFNMGITFGANKDFSTDLGVEYLGFERKSELKKASNTLGMGVNPILRINYNF